MLWIAKPVIPKYERIKCFDKSLFDPCMKNTPKKVMTQRIASEKKNLFAFIWKKFFV